MPKGDLLYFGHMLDAARGARAAIEGITREAFDADENLRLAQVHRIQIIGVIRDLPTLIAALEKFVPEPEDD